MKYSTFEKLPVWKAAVAFALKVLITEKADFRGLGDTKNQLERAALSVSNNIAEGFERGTTARGSAGESRSMLRICESLSRFSNFKSEISNLIGQAVNISKHLHGWIDSLKNSEIKGVKFYNEKGKTRIAQKKEIAEFDREMDDFRLSHEQWLIERQKNPDARL